MSPGETIRCARFDRSKNQTGAGKFTSACREENDNGY
jgi:hypothetical protein